ncbi:MAG: 2-oxoglutarate dehydrogenase E1 component [Chloroflexales bacterium]|nr:2-oxoglutarate dehydrogenase E1 component [Chloroflexales bacterium]
MTDFLDFHGPNAGYVLELYERYLHNPESVDEATRAIFAVWSPPDAKPSALHGATTPISPVSAAPQYSNKTRSTPSDAPTSAETMPAYSEARAGSEPTVSTTARTDQPTLEQRVADTTLDVTRIVGAARLIRYIRELGHLGARIDPLGSTPPGDPGIELTTHGVTQADLAALPAHIVRGPLIEGSANALEAVEKLRRAYCGSIGYETDHIQVYEERTWLREAIEDHRFFQNFDSDRQREMLDRLTEVETFELFLHKTFPGQKRFSIEGTDMLVPVVDAIIRNAASAGTREVVIGMAHRGRLNVLAHILGKPYTAVLTEFHSPDYIKDTYAGWTGDVKYHLGARKAYRESGISEMPITLAPNPSHLEFVNAVIQGRARAAQELRNRPGYPAEAAEEALAVLIHGDASFPGQGIVAETLNLSSLAGYRTGGTIHVIINNQIGFTTNTRDARSTLYASDLAKGFEIPIVHVNADDPEACIAVARMAWAYRERFQKDFLIDLVGYRRWGHNEGDEPAYTQPGMYEIITRHPSVRELWARELERRGYITRDEAQARVSGVQKRLQQAFDEIRSKASPKERENGRVTTEVQLPSPPVIQPLTVEQLAILNEALLRRPKGFTAHPRLERMLQRRNESLNEPGGIDWAHAEALAIAAILSYGVPIRMTGQDTERGTFSQRHLVLYDVKSGKRFIPHHALPHARASFAVYNSPLSENAVLGFEYGYSTHAPDTLVIWEAQFGDFANGAQVIIDQFIASGRAKWNQRPSLVLLLPHGYEGQGPEHSSARLERFLQLAANSNIRVANCTTAAQYYHLLRRHAALLKSDPCPLIVMTPKSLLRHPLAASSLSDLTESQFQPVLPPPPDSIQGEDVNRLVLCSGKVYVDLVSSGELDKVEGVAVARIEELYPFPQQELSALLVQYQNLREIVWLQEEPRNMGSWTYIEPRLRGVAGPSLPIIYCGRPESASPAEGTHSQHVIVQSRILCEAVQSVVVAG